jgi:hypothetical protein
VTPSFGPHFTGGGGGGVIEHLIKEEILNPLDFTDFDQCIKGKFAKQIKEGVVRSIGLLELIHTGICGPFPIESLDGFNSFITFTDDYLICGNIYPIKHISESFVKL